MRTAPKFRGDMVRLARHARGMTQKEVAERVGITQAYVSMIEDDERHPTSEQEERIAQALDFPVAFFYLSDPVLGPSVGEIYHRRRQSVPAKQLERFYAWSNIETFSARKLLEAVDWPATSLVPLTLDVDVKDEEEAAAFLRAKWYAPKGPVRSVSALLAQAGILVIPHAYGVLDIDGMSYWLSDMPPVISVNTEMTQDRLRFTLLHEVGHLALHHRSIPRSVSDTIEDEANRFASAFLMPSDEIRPHLRNLTVTKLADLKRHWRVSMSALLMRAKQLETVSPREEQALWREMSKNGWKRREPEQLDVEGEDPSVMYRQLVELYTSQLGYTAEQLARKLSLSSKDIQARYPNSRGKLRLLG